MSGHHNRKIHVQCPKNTEPQNSNLVCFNPNLEVYLLCTMKICLYVANIQIGLVSYKWNFLRHQGWNFWLCFRLRHIDYFKASDFFKGPKNTIKQMEMIHHKVCISIPYSSLKSRWCLYCERFMTRLHNNHQIWWIAKKQRNYGCFLFSDIIKCLCSNF